MPSKTVDVRESPGFVQDRVAHHLKDSAFTDVSNAVFTENGAESRSGNLQTFSTPLTSPTWLWPFPPITNPTWVYADSTKVYALNGATHVDITRVSSDYSTSSEQRWHAGVFNGVGVLNNTTDIPQAWTSFDTSTLLVDLANWDSNRRCKSLRPFKNFLVALNMTDTGIDRPYRVVWSDSAAPGTLPGSWDTTDPTTDAREFDLAETSDHLVDSLPLGDINIIYKENSTWGMQYIGPPFYFRFWKILSTRGLLHRDCVVASPIGHIAATQDDIIVHTGQMEQHQSIVDKRTRKWLFSTIDPDNFFNSYAVSYTKRNEFWFCFPEVGETYATAALIWNWSQNSIGFEYFDRPFPFITMGSVGESTVADLEWG